jgi:coenzyme F420-reducing hydrogenase beta subunit
MESCNAWSKDAALRHVSASGGVISTMIRVLLTDGIYDGAFCLDTYDYRGQLKTRLFTPEEVAENWAQSDAPKSRYLPVSHENAVRYLKANRNQKLIFVGTSCALRGLQGAIRKLNLNQEQYLFIGLFCDKVFNYNVLTYFENTYAQGTKLEALHFKNKESGGWPGDMKFYPEGQDPFYVPLAERAKAKAYFMAERCLYCVDKLNVCADISLGDNYTGKDESPLGSNSVIVRSDAGMDAWSAVKELPELRPIGIEDIQNAQAVDWRLDQLYYGDLRSSNAPDLNQGVPREKVCASFKTAYRAALKRLKTGAVYDNDPDALLKQMRKDKKKPNPVVRFVRRAAGFVRRRLMR